MHTIDLDALIWSIEYPFQKKSIEDFAPLDPGVYQILQSIAYPRYEGVTHVLKIGLSEKNLRKEISNHLSRHVAANRLERIRLRHCPQLSFRFSIVDRDVAAAVEKDLLRQFEDRHWDLPTLNAQRGYGRDSDKHYRL